MCHTWRNKIYAVWITVFLFTIILEVAKTETIHDNNTIITHGKNCECIVYDCGCCTHIEWDGVSLNGTLCTNASYLDHDYGFSITVTYNKVAIINETVSARNPPPICIGEDITDFPIAACFRLYDITINGTHFNVCFELEARIARLNILPLHLGCVNNNHKDVPSSDISLTSHGHIFKNMYVSIFSIILAHMMTKI